jgi:hypothetical protein
LVEKVDQQDFGKLLPMAKPAKSKAEVKPNDFRKDLYGNWVATDGVTEEINCIYPDGNWGVGANGPPENGFTWKLYPASRSFVMSRPGIWRGTFTLSFDGNLLSGQNNVGTKNWMIKLDD